MIRLGTDVAELGMTMCSAPHRPDLICLEMTKQQEDAIQPD